MSAVFSKTPKGHEEITTKAGGLKARTRRVLIFIDGNRSVAELTELHLGSELQSTLDMLQAEGYIEVANSAGKTGHAKPVPAEALPAAAAFRPAPDPVNREELEMARNFIQNTLKTFCGPYAHLEIVEAAFAAQTHEEIRLQFEPWHHAIEQTAPGKKRSDQLCSQLLKVI